MIDDDIDIPELVPSLIVDTSIYRADPDRTGVGFRLLERLAIAKKLVLHVPHFVAEEFRTHQCGLYDKGLRDIMRGLKALKRKRMPQEGMGSLSEVVRNVNAVAGALDGYANQEIEEWWTTAGAVMHAVAAGHGARVAQRYFTGAPPFKTAKSREDFPDAFILESAIDIARDHFSVAIVTGDKRLGEACAAHGIPAYETIAAYIESGQVEDLYEELEETQAQELLSRLPQSVTKLAPSLVQEVTDRVVAAEHRIAGLPLGLDEAYVEALDETSDTPRIEARSAEYLGEGLIAVPFTWQPVAELSVTIARSRLYEIPDAEVDEYSLSPHTDLTVNAAFTRELEITGTLTLDAGSSLGDGELDAATVSDLAALSTVELESLRLGS